MTDYAFESLGQAWVFGLREAIGRGDIVEDEQVNLRDISLDEGHDLLNRYKSKTDDTKLHLKLKEVLGYSITIENASPDDPIIKEFANQERINYTRKRYGRNCGENGYGIFIYGENGQNVDIIVDRLQQNPHSKSAVINAPNSWAGNGGKPPCLASISFLIRDSKLHLFIVYRSQNIYTKQPGNILALCDLQQEIAEKLGIPAGAIHLFASSAHVYESDWEHVAEIMSKTSV